ncbi:MAG: hypothetical protein QT02_C0001G0010 [archaeon GW2011_AR9]|nr:MAG: hypothetical protein QT02_C0001G0010 [archaeon GW2011_AR9]HIH12625.1 hypothetical protein [Candidatus Woesearchaeota archaeon]
MMELPEFIREIGQVYAAIVIKIEDLLEVLNNAIGQQDKHTRELAQRISTFLQSLQKSLNVAKKSAATLSPEKKAQFLALFKREMEEIKKLRSYLALAKKRPQPEIITKIHLLYQEVKKTMAQEEVVLR